MLAGGTNPTLAFRVTANRGFRELRLDDVDATSRTILEPMFLDFDVSTPITISAVDKQRRKHRLTLALSERGSLSELPESVTSTSSEEIEASATSTRTIECRYEGPGGQEQLSKLVFHKGAPPQAEPGNLKIPIQAILQYARSQSSPASDAERYGRLEVEKEQEHLLEALQIIEPRLQRLATITSSGLPMIHADIGLTRLLPLALMGDGLGRLVTLLLVIANCRGGIALLDEIENGIHHSIMAQAWAMIGDAALRYDVQLLATTHSLEFIRAAQDAFADKDDSFFRLHRLDRAEGRVKSTSYDKESLEAALDAELEVR